MRQLVAVLFVLCGSGPAFSDTIVRFQPGGHRNAASASAGYDYSIVTLELGYNRAFHLSKINRPLILDTGFSVPVMAFDFKDFKINLGAQISAINYKYFQLPVSLNILLRNTANEAYNAFGFGTELGIYPRFYTDKLTVAAEAVWDAEWATYITFSDYYKEVIYQDGVEGWYGATGHIFRFGARIGGLIKRRVEIYARGGFELQGKYNVKIPPAYGILGAAIRF